MQIIVRLLSENDSVPDTWHLYAMCLHASGQFDDALKAVEDGRMVGDLAIFSKRACVSGDAWLMALHCIRCARKWGCRRMMSSCNRLQSSRNRSRQASES